MTAIMLQNSIAEDFLSKVRALSGRIHILVAQVDPDALGSAIAIADILEKLEKEVAIFFAGGIGHQQNRALFNRYNLKARMETIANIPESPTNLVLVDSSSTKDGRLPQSLTVDPVLVIDHHRGSETENYREDAFIWIEEVGSASTLVVELLLSLQETADFSLDWSRETAMLLALGIYTDTKRLVMANHRDREAFGTATLHIDPQEFGFLVDYPLPETHFENMKRALNKCDTKGSRTLAGLGIMSAKDGDDLATIADYLLRRKGVYMVITWGIINGNLRVCARSNDTDPLDEKLRTLFGDNSGAKLLPGGTAEGGALVDIGLDLWLVPETEEKMCDLVHERLKVFLFHED